MRRVKRRSEDSYYAVGPGPLPMLDAEGNFDPVAVPQGQYGVAFDTPDGSRLQSRDTFFVSYEQAQESANWLNSTLD
jgi:hypothetical protein